MDNVCRICLNSEDLFSVFDNRVHENTQNIIKVVTGVEILSTDSITQKVCKTCWQFAIQIYKFRNKALINNKNLQEKKNRKPIPKIKIINNVIIQQGKIKPSTTTLLNKNIFNKLHPSLKKIIKENPTYKYPNNLRLNENYGPYITLWSNEIEEYFNNQKYKLNTNSESKVEKINSKKRRWRDSINNYFQSDSDNEEKDLTNVDHEIQGKKKNIEYSITEEDMTNNSSKNETQSSILKNLSNNNPAINKSTIVNDEKVNNIRIETDQSISNLNEDINLILSENSSNSDNINYKIDNDKVDFAKSLNLIPKGADVLQELFVSSKNKTVPVYTCSVCNSVHNNKKSLNMHEKRNHTKCPFCNIKFKTIKLKNEHILNECTNQQNIRYENSKSSSFVGKEDSDKNKTCTNDESKTEEMFVNVENIDKVPIVGSDSEFNLEVNQEICENSSLKNDQQCKKSHNTDSNNSGNSKECEESNNNSSEAITEIKNDSEVTSEKPDSNGNSKTEELSLDYDSDAYVIDLLNEDDDNDERLKLDEIAKHVKVNKNNIDCAKLFITDKNFINDINLAQSDIEIIKQIKELSSKNFPFQYKSSIKVSPVGTTVNFKNFYEEIEQYKIPLEIKYNKTLNVKFELCKNNVITRHHDSWENIPPVTLIKPNKNNKTVSSKAKDSSSLEKECLQTDTSSSKVGPSFNIIYKDGGTLNRISKGKSKRKPKKKPTKSTTSNKRSTVETSKIVSQDNSSVSILKNELTKELVKDVTPQSKILFSVVLSNKNSNTLTQPKTLQENISILNESLQKSKEYIDNVQQTNLSVSEAKESSLENINEKQSNYLQRSMSQLRDTNVISNTTVKTVVSQASTALVQLKETSKTYTETSKITKSISTSCNNNSIENFSNTMTFMTQQPFNLINNSNQPFYVSNTVIPPTISHNVITPYIPLNRNVSLPSTVILQPNVMVTNPNLSLVNVDSQQKKQTNEDNYIYIPLQKSNGKLLKLTLPQMNNSFNYKASNENNQNNNLNTTKINSKRTSMNNIRTNNFKNDAPAIRVKSLSELS